MAEPKDYLSPGWRKSGAVVASGGATTEEGTESKAVIANVLFPVAAGGVFDQTLTATAIASTTTVASPALSATVGLVVAAITSTTTVAAPALSGTAGLVVASIASTATIASPALSATVGLTVASIASTTTVPTAVVSTSTGLVAASITGTITISAPTLANPGMEVAAIGSTLSVLIPVMSRFPLPRVIPTGEKRGIGTLTPEPRTGRPRPFNVP